MKYLLKFLILVMILGAVLVFLSVFSGCATLPQPELHPIVGTSVMFVPKGCKIGDITVPENGIYISESILIEQMLKENEEEREQRKRQSQTQIR